jgi:hypothetical protein
MNWPAEALRKSCARRRLGVRQLQSLQRPFAMIFAYPFFYLLS